MAVWKVAAMNAKVGLTSDAEAEDFFIQTLEQAIDAVVIIDDHNRVVFFNSAAETFWGCPRIEVLGRNVSSLVPHTYAPIMMAISVLTARLESTR